MRTLIKIYITATGDDDGVIFEEDSEDEEGYMFDGQGTFDIVLPSVHILYSLI